jgi:hypothetical protein
MDSHVNYAHDMPNEASGQLPVHGAADVGLNKLPSESLPTIDAPTCAWLVGRERRAQRSSWQIIELDCSAGDKVACSTMVIVSICIWPRLTEQIEAIGRVECLLLHVISADRTARQDRGKLIPFSYGILRNAEANNLGIMRNTEAKYR